MEHHILSDTQGLTTRRGAYGFDEPIWPCLLSFVGLLFLLLGFVNLWIFKLPILGLICCVCAVILLLSVVSYLYTTRQGKFQVWADILHQLGPRGDEDLLDVGCGRGAVLLMAARHLPKGKATGIDVWRVYEQSGNALAATQQNAEREEVAERVVLHTADTRQLPFGDASFDLLVSSMAIHNIPEPEGRVQAITEAVRVLKPGGKLVIVDFRATSQYEKQLGE
jgi:SAM-dependent methyltransferase